MTSTLNELLDAGPAQRDRRSNWLHVQIHHRRRQMAEMRDLLEEQTLQMAEIGRALGMLMELELARSESSKTSVTACALYATPAGTLGSTATAEHAARE
jgi:hypothetical protein